MAVYLWISTCHKGGRGVEANKMKCPRCGSENIEEETDHSKLYSILPAFWGTKKVCKDCKYEFD